jgi:hypothetical protein
MRRRRRGRLQPLPGGRAARAARARARDRALYDELPPGLHEVVSTFANAYLALTLMRRLERTIRSTGDDFATALRRVLA